MSTRITGSLVVCATAGLFTLGALLLDPSPSRPPVSPAPFAATTTAKPGGAGAKQPAATASLVIADFGFAPVTARPGAAVTVTNRDGEAHTVTASDRSFNVRVNGNGTATFAAPTAPGTYAFVCSIHPSMRGRLVVA